MKNSFLMMVIILMCITLCLACSDIDNEDYLRIHIRANSNLSVDQNIKYFIKDEVVEYLTPYIVNCESIDDVKTMVLEHKNSLENLIDEILIKNGLEYASKVELNNEYFPTRSYDNLTLEANFYDAIIIKLGSGEGDNWWCVVYPPLCFKETKNVVYKSKIVEIINQVFGD